MRELNQASLGIPGRQDLTSLNDQICSFEESFSKLEEAEPENVVPCTKSAIKRAFAVTQNGGKLPERLAALDCPTVLLDARDVREVGKISNYWRISRHLAKCVHHFRLNFANAEWYAVPSYKPSCGSQTLRRRFVHAEIQILAYYETMPVDTASRCIGVSKEACFLCDCFIRAHAMFMVSGAHRQMVCQWTVPDLKEYSTESIVRIRRALSRVCEEVTEEYLQSQKKHPRRSFPLQSAINLDVIHLPTPSVSTLYDPRSIENAVASTAEPRPTDCQDERDTQAVTEHEGIESTICYTKMQQQCEVQDTRGNKQQGPRDVWIDIAVDEAALEYTRWVSLVATCLPSPTTDPLNPRSSKCLKCSVSIEPVSRREGQRIISLDEISAGDGIEVSRDASDAPNELSFVLAGGRGEHVQIRCRWHV